MYLKENVLIWYGMYNYVRNVLRNVLRNALIMYVCVYETCAVVRKFDCATFDKPKRMSTEHVTLR